MFAATVGGLVLLASGVTSIRYLARTIRAVFRKLEAIDALLSRELEHNHGSSIKDDVAGTAVAVGKLGREVDNLTVSTDRRFRKLEAAVRRHHPEEGI